MSIPTNTPAVAVDQVAAAASHCDRPNHFAMIALQQPEPFNTNEWLEKAAQVAEPPGLPLFEIVGDDGVVGARRHQREEDHRH